MIYLELLRDIYSTLVLVKSNYSFFNVRHLSTQILFNGMQTNNRSACRNQVVFINLLYWCALPLENLPVLAFII